MSVDPKPAASQCILKDSIPTLRAFGPQCQCSIAAPNIFTATGWAVSPGLFHLRYSHGRCGAADPVPLWAAMLMWLTLWVRYLSIVGWRLPRQWASYHLRLDWLMRFAAISPGYAQPWLTPFLRRLLRNDPPTLRLLGRNPFPESPAPVRARATLRVPLHHAGRTAARPGMVAPHASGWIRPAHDGAQDDVPAQQLSAGRTGGVYFW
jgi:hypothetical protein